MKAAISKYPLVVHSKSDFTRGDYLIFDYALNWIKGRIQNYNSYAINLGQKKTDPVHFLYSNYLKLICRISSMPRLTGIQFVHLRFLIHLLPIFPGQK